LNFNKKEIEGRKGENVLKELFPKIIKIALDLPKKICKPIPILKAGKYTFHSREISEKISFLEKKYD
jgi:hypothetical protein